MELILLNKTCQPCVNNHPLILAVDDDEDNLLLLREVIEPMGCSLISATHGKAALILAQDCQPELILLDVMLPDFNGIEVVKRLRHNPLTKTIPIVALTAMARSEDRERLLLAGCNDYISKPYMLADLEEVITRYLSLTPSVA